MSLKEYLDLHGWSVSDLARESRISWEAANNAVQGKTIQRRTARDIAEALSAATGQRINVGDIVGLNFS